MPYSRNLFLPINLILLQYFGSQGLHTSSFVVGFTHIVPFLLNLFQGKYNVTSLLISLATFRAMGSNTILKAIYGIWFGARQMVKYDSGIWNYYHRKPNHYRASTPARLKVTVA